MTCPDCGREVPPHMKHELSMTTSGYPYGGKYPCKWFAIDSEGRSWRERGNWRKLQTAERRARQVARQAA